MPCVYNARSSALKPRQVDNPAPGGARNPPGVADDKAVANDGVYGGGAPLSAQTSSSRPPASRGRSFSEAQWQQNRQEEHGSSSTTSSDEGDREADLIDGGRESDDAGSLSPMAEVEEVEDVNAMHHAAELGLELDGDVHLDHEMLLPAGNAGFDGETAAASSSHHHHHTQLYYQTASPFLILGDATVLHGPRAPHADVLSFTDDLFLDPASLLDLPSSPNGDETRGELALRRTGGGDRDRERDELLRRLSRRSSGSSPPVAHRRRLSAASTTAMLSAPFFFSSPGSPAVDASLLHAAFGEFSDRRGRRGLVDHFCNVLSHLIVFREETGNPFQQLVLPLAARSEPVLNAVYALSCAHLEYRGCTAADDDAAAPERSLLFHNRAIQGLARLIDQGHELRHHQQHVDAGGAATSGFSRNELLAAIMLLVYYEVVSSADAPTRARLDFGWRPKPKPPPHAIEQAIEHDDSMTR